MPRLLFLAWRYAVFNKWKTAILTGCFTLTIALPSAMHLLIRSYGAELTGRAERTPMIVGARGNRYDLCLKTLYFRGATPDAIDAAEFDRVAGSGLATPIAVSARHTARGYPLVGVSIEYFDFRGLAPAMGGLPTILGEAVLGAAVAAETGLGVGDRISSDQVNLYDIARRYPLRMRVVGVLAPSGSPDDHAVFTDVRSAWVIDGHSHGHMDAASMEDPNLILDRGPGSVVTTAAVYEYMEITPENIDTFHFHGDPGRFPLTSLIVVPRDAKAATILAARYGNSRTAQAILPTEVIAELMGIVFRVETFFKASFALVFVAVSMLQALVIALSLRLRKRELETMFRIGCSRSAGFVLVASEVAMVLAASAALAAALAAGALAFAPDLAKVL